MIGARVDRYSARIRNELRRSFAEEHTPREIAGSFAIGTFITMLPTLGFGLLVFLVIVLVFDQISKLALFASVLVFNPVVKWGVYVASFVLGSFLLGPVDGVNPTDVTIDAGTEILTRLLVGNFILAVVAASISYIVVVRLAVAYQTSEFGAIIDDVVEQIVEDIIND